MKQFGLVCFIVACALSAAAPLAVVDNHPARTQDSFPGWPASFEGKPLKALELTPIEARFQQNFPGRVGRFTDGQREIIIRWVSEGTRKLHASADCFKANGYELTTQPVSAVGSERWSGFIAAKGEQRFDVRERIVDGKGGQWSDVSAWYWAVQLGQTRGPWWAVTVAQNVHSPTKR